MTVILGFVTRTLVVMQNASTGSSLRLQNLDEARVLMDLVSKDIRTAARMTPTTSPFDVTACTANGQVQPCVPAGWTPGGNAAPYVGKSELWFYANLTLANQYTGVAVPGHRAPVRGLDGQPAGPEGADDLRRQPHDRRPAELLVRGARAPYTGTFSTRLVGKYIVNGTSSCITPDPVFVYWYDDGTGTPAALRHAPWRRSVVQRRRCR